MKLKNASILITGGAGFIGSHLVDSLLTYSPKRIIILDNLIRGSSNNIEHVLQNKRIEFVNGDIRDKRLVDKLMVGIDLVYHEAALKHNLCTTDPELGHDVLVNGTFNVFDSASRSGVAKIIFASSASVYGGPTKLPMKESDSFNNNTIYGAGKIYSERLAIAFRKLRGIEYVGLRYFNVYGPRMDTSGIYTEVLIRWMNNIRAGVAPIIYGDGVQSTDFIYIDDVVCANILAARKNIKEGIFNVGTGKETTLLELFTMMLKLTKSGLKPIFKSAEKFSLANRRRASTTLAKKELGFIARIELEKGLRKFIDWYNNSI